MESEKERLERRSWGQKRGPKRSIRPMPTRVTNRQNGATGARTGGNTRQSEDRENGRSAFRPPMNGGGNVAVIETSPHRTAPRVPGRQQLLKGMPVSKPSGTTGARTAAALSFVIRGLLYSRDRPNRPNRPSGVQNCPRWLLVSLGMGRLAGEVAISAHRTIPRVERRAGLRATG